MKKGFFNYYQNNGDLYSDKTKISKAKYRRKGLTFKLLSNKTIKLIHFNNHFLYGKEKRKSIIANFAKIEGCANFHKDIPLISNYILVGSKSIKVEDINNIMFHDLYLSGGILKKIIKKGTIREVKCCEEIKISIVNKKNHYLFHAEFENGCLLSEGIKYYLIFVKMFSILLNDINVSFDEAYFLDNNLKKYKLLVNYNKECNFESMFNFDDLSDNSIEKLYDLIFKNDKGKKVCFDYLNIDDRYINESVRNVCRTVETEILNRKDIFTKSHEGVEELKKECKEKVLYYEKEEKISESQKDNILSNIEYWGSGLKDKIFAMYKKFKKIITKYSEINGFSTEDYDVKSDIDKFVNYRNLITHPGEDDCCYIMLLTKYIKIICMVSLFDRIGISENIIVDRINKIEKMHL